MSGGYVALTPGLSQADTQSILNAQNSEQYGVVAQAWLTVANAAALAAIASYYKVTGKRVFVVDSDGVGTPQLYQWAGSWVATSLNLKPVGALVHSGASLAPSGEVFHVDGTTQINTITGFAAGLVLILIPDAVWTTGTSGNIGKASTAVVGVALTMVYDGTKWWPSY